MQRHRHVLQNERVPGDDEQQRRPQVLAAEELGERAARFLFAVRRRVEDLLVVVWQLDPVPFRRGLDDLLQLLLATFREQPPRRLGQEVPVRTGVLRGRGGFRSTGGGLPEQEQPEPRRRDGQLKVAPIPRHVRDAGDDHVGDGDRQQVQDADDRRPLPGHHFHRQHEADVDDRHRDEAHREPQRHVPAERLHDTQTRS